MRYLVVGGNGFMGRHLVERLLEGESRVRVYGRSGLRDASGGVEFVEGELGNYGLIKEAVEGIDVVYHLVSTTLPKTSNDDPVYDVRSNLVDTVQLLEACVAAGVRKVVFSSSVGVYGMPKTLPISEDHPTNPTFSYGIVKLAIEKYLELFRYLYGLEYAALRISNPYGPYQNPKAQQGVMGIILQRLYKGETMTVWGDGTALRDYLYVSDLVDALQRAAKAEPEERVMNIGSGRGVSINELLQTVAEVTGEQPAVEYLPARTLDVPASVLDVGRAKAELGWEPTTQLAEGIARTWDWIHAHHEGRVKP